MVDGDTLLVLGVVGGSFLAVLLGLAMTAALANRRAAPAGLFATEDEQSVFLFADDDLLDATRLAHQILAAAPKEGSDWSRLSRLLAPRLPDFAGARDRALDQGRTTLLSTDGATRVVLDPKPGALRLSIIDVETANPTVEVDRISLEAARRELQTVQAIAEGVPWIVWREGMQDDDLTGSITWANSAYLEAAARLTGQDETWPPPHIFDTDPARDGCGEPRRLALRNSNKAPSDWYVIYGTPVADGMIYSAVTAEREVATDAAFGAFRQTLSQTFASLSIGLAVFDRGRMLTMFNPALTDTLSLPVDFVAAKPSLFAFLDRLREDRRMPEPRNYKDWRANLAALEGGAAGAGYGATWTLTDGQVLRVTGRPHGDGAFVLIFEDITTEIALTRQFRAELEMGQAVLDSLDEAVAVFDPSGVLAMSNEAYSTLWGSDPRTTLGDLTLPEATHRWISKTAATPAWKALEDFARQKNDRAGGWSDAVRMTDGRGLIVRVAPLAGGATLVGFRIDTADRRRSVDMSSVAPRKAGAAH